MNTTAVVEDLVRHFATSNGIHESNYKIRYNSKLNQVAACQKVYPHFDGDKYQPGASQFIFYFSRKFLQHLSRTELVDIVIHEVAHALTDPREETHGSIWRATAQKMGGSGSVLHKASESQNEAMKKYRGVCPQGHKFYRNRKSPHTNYYCPPCTPVVMGRASYNKESLIEWTTLR